VEYTNGRIRLVLHENLGRYSLYFMTGTNRTQYEPFFVDQDPRTSFLTLILNDRAYRLGEVSTFKTRIGGTLTQPALIFESPDLLITQEFSFISTYGSALCNGVRINICIENRGEQVVAGLRLLLDTSLGEGREPGVPFVTDLRQISSETVIDRSDTDRWWISRNDRLGLMGSISGTDLTRPDLIHFANWKRFNDTPWKLSYTSGRNFNLPPYSIGDSAVCYYFDPRVLTSGESLTISLILAAEDVNGFTLVRNAPIDQGVQSVQESLLSSGSSERAPTCVSAVRILSCGCTVRAPSCGCAGSIPICVSAGYVPSCDGSAERRAPSSGSTGSVPSFGSGGSTLSSGPTQWVPETELTQTDEMRADLAELQALIARMDQYLSSEITVSDEELAVMERKIALLKAMYGL
jgi:hypothetical protein